MTRMTGSVPEARSTTRPSSPSSRLDLLHASCTAGTGLGSKRRATFTLISTCGNLGMPAASSRERLAGLRCMTASTCSALTRASPVVVLSRHRMCPEVSPPSTPPVSRSMSEHVPIADLARAGNRCPARAARSPARSCS